ncbi:hypothetical protein JL721_3524 [Aureococcus anophagefferens]|nr:hypothetical protein JL721_3524 [Aureococcus anophagefferens]
MLVAPCDAGAAPPEDGAPHRKHPTPLKREARRTDEALAARRRALLEAYGHVANFARLAPDGQRVAFWAKVGAVYEALVKQGRPVWLSTEGSGVPWLHVRMDSRPATTRESMTAVERTDAALFVGRGKRGGRQGVVCDLERGLEAS